MFLIANLQATKNTSLASPEQGTDFGKVHIGSSSLNVELITTSREPHQQPVQCSFQKVNMLGWADSSLEPQTHFLPLFMCNSLTAMGRHGAIFTRLGREQPSAFSWRQTSFFFLIYDFLYFWLCWVFTVCMGFSLVAVRRLLIAVASHVAERGF